MRQILFVASEVVPFIKTGGLADVAGALPKYLNKEEYEVRVILPKYACMDARWKNKLHFVCHFYVDLNWRRQYAGILETTYEGIQYYFVDNEFYFSGAQPYNHIYEDVEKFAFFSKAVLMALPYLNYQPNVIHCNDWQTGLVPVFLHTTYGSDPFYFEMKTVFTIYNLKFQGRWKIQEVMDITGLPEQIFSPNGLESYGEANYLKGGCVYADVITTVSPTFAGDICTPEGGEGLDGLLSARGNDLYGIINGLDYEIFNPEKDGYIARQYQSDTVFQEKVKNKFALQDMFQLQRDEDVFLLGMVSRLTDQKGLDLLSYIMDELCTSMRVQIVILGTGEKRHEESLKYFENRYPARVSVYLGYSEEKAHMVYAGCDAFLMPSLFEPCGLSQLISMRYGTLPIVRETGGLKDTVEAFNEYTNTGNGFSFENYNAHDFLHTIQYALSVYYDKRSQWNEMMVRAMKEDFSWDSSAREYEQIYERLLPDFLPELRAEEE